MVKLLGEGEPHSAATATIASLEEANPSFDALSEESLAHMIRPERVKKNFIPNVQTVLVVYSSKGTAFDQTALVQQIGRAYRGAQVFVCATSGCPLGPVAPDQIDLLIDLTGEDQRQSCFFVRRLRKRARFAVGRAVGRFRSHSYDRVFDVAAMKAQGRMLPAETNEREIFIQRQVLELAGVAMLPCGPALPDLGKSIALGLPGMQHL